MALPAQPDAAGISVLAQLPLLPFLAASPGPALVLPLSPLAHALRSRQTLSPLRTPLWSGKAASPSGQAHGASSVAEHDSGKPAGKRSRAHAPGSDVLRGIEGLNVKTPLGHAQEVPGGSDYFSLTPSAEGDGTGSGSDARRPSTASLSSASSADAFLAAPPIEGAVSPLTDDDLTPSASEFESDRLAAATLLALNPVYCNEAWRNLEMSSRRSAAGLPGRQTAGNGTAGGASAGLRAATVALTRAGMLGRGKRRRSSLEDEDVLMGLYPSAPGFERQGSGGRSSRPLRTVEEEEHGMDTEDDDESLASGADDTTTDDQDEDDSSWHSVYAFLSPDDQATLLAFVLDLVEDQDNGYPGSDSGGFLSPPAVSPMTTPGPAGTPRWSSANATPHGNASKLPYSFPPPTRRLERNSQLPQTIRLDNYLISATLVPFSPNLGLSSPSVPIDASEASPFGSHASASGFVILTMAPPAPPEPFLHQGPPRSTANSSAPSSRQAAEGPAPYAQSAARNVGNVYTSLSTLTETRTPSSSMQVTASTLSPPPKVTFPLASNEDPWVRALGDTEMGRRIRTHPWHETPLGPISAWQPELRTMVASVLASPFRECILWGQDMVIVYNDLYIDTAGMKHPGLLGLSARDGWSEIWDGLNSLAQRTMTGETCFFRDHFLAMERLGFVEETYHTFSYAPFYDSEGKVLGILNLSIETTATVVAARRLATVRDLVQMTSLARTVDDFAASALKAFAANPYDLPFVQLFTVEEVTNTPSRKEVRAGYDRSTRNVIKLTNRGSTGIPHGHPFLVQEALVDITPPKSRHSSSSASTSTGTNSTATMLDMRERLETAASLTPVASAGSPAPSISSSASTASAGGPTPVEPQWTWPFEEACLKRDLILVEDLGPAAESLDRSHGWAYPVRQGVVIPIFVEVGQTIPSAVLVFGINSMSSFTQLMEVFFNLVARHVAIGLFAVLAAEQDRQRADELVKLDRAKSNFFSSVSHELRTPLTLILGPVDDLLSGSERDKLDRAQRDRLVLVQRHANRLLTMVNKLLDFSSIEGGRMNFVFRPVQIGSLTRDIAILFRDAIERTGLKYTIHCDEDPADCLPIYLSPDLWDKVVQNVISNAWKYTVQGEITVALHSTRAEAVLSVSDTGIGIPQSELGKIFDRFHRIDANSRMATGTGIGLALTLELVKLLGGQLEVESELGKGSTFTVRLQRGHTHLPIEQVDHTLEDTTLVAQFQNRNLAVVDEAASWRYDTDAQDALAVPPSSASSSDSTMAGSEQGNSSGSGSGEDYMNGVDVLSLKNRTIVLVDDSRDLRTYMASLLAKHFTVVQFGDPREALEYVNRSPPSLVLTDAMMPYISGQDLTSALRRNPATNLIPIIMVSAQAGTEARAEALEGGVDDYLVKPFQARELLARVRVHLQLGLLRAELERRVDERTRALIESEAQNRALASRYAMLSTVSPVGVVQIDAKGEPVFCNPRWFEISGMTLGRPLAEWLEMIVPEDVQKVENAWKAATGGATTEAPERQFRLKNGRWAQLEIRASTEVGLPDGYVGALTDITRQKEIEMLHIREVEQRAIDAEENRRNTEMFLDMSSHELRNPLSGVWQNAEVVSASLAKYVELIDHLRHGDPVPPEALNDLYNEMLENVEAVESIILCASHQGRIADDILNVSKLNMGLLSINVAPFDLVAAVREVVKTFEVQSHQQQINLVVERGSSLDDLNVDYIAADSGRIKQVLYNFLTNALKYTLDSLRKKVVVHIEASPGPPRQPPAAMRVASPNAASQVPDNAVWVVISVQDSGKGLSPEQLKRLFARFSQANPKSDQYGGSGLGLYVSKKLVELHGGLIEVESELGQGSVFRFAIPASRAKRTASPPSSIAIPTSTVPTGKLARPRSAGGCGAGTPLVLPPASPSPTVGTGLPAAKSGPPPRKTHVLVVEDNLINQRVLLRQLKTAGYDVTVANHGQEALDILMADAVKAASGEAADKQPIDAVLMDIEMPVMGGLQAIRELRRRETAGEISHRYPVCAVTGNAREAQQSECLAAGFNDVATKPYKLEDVLTKITMMTGRPAPQPK